MKKIQKSSMNLVKKLFLGKRKTALPKKCGMASCTL